MNMELVVIPLILKIWWGLDGWGLKIATCVWATLEMFYWYWFAGWLKEEFKFRKSEKLKNAVNEAQSIGQDAIEELKDAGIFDRTEEWIKCHLVDPFDSESHTNKKIFIFLKGSGYVVGLPFLVFLGSMPVLWIAGLAFCRFFNLKTGNINNSMKFLDAD